MAGRRRARREGRTPRNRWVRWVWRGVAVLSGVLVLGMLGGYVGLKNYLGSEGFREMVNRRLSESLRAEARVERFDWDGMMVRVPRFTAEGIEMVEHVEMVELDTEVSFSGLLRREVEAGAVHVRRLHMELDATGEGPRFGREEGTVEVESLEVGEFSGRVGLREGAVSWQGVRARLRAGSIPGSYDATLGRGRLSTPLGIFPDSRLVEGRVRYADGSLFVTSSNWRVYEAGRLSLDGEVRLEGGEYVFSASLDDVQCEEILPDNWRRRLRGELSSEFTVEGERGRAPVIEGEIRLVRGQLTALPVLDRIAAYTDIERFRRLALGEAHLDFRKEGERLDLTEIVLSSEGLVRVEGRLSIVAGQLDGTFQVGVPPGILARIPGAETKVFAPGKSGMLWAPLAISGTTGRPKEDLSNRLFVAAGERMIEMVAGEPVLKFTGQPVGEAAMKIIERTGELAGLGARAIGQGAGVVGEGAEVVRSGVDSLLGGILGGRSEAGGKNPTDEGGPEGPEEDVEPGGPGDGPVSGGDGESGGAGMPLLPSGADE